MTKNMTEGRSLPLILKFALPLLLGNIFQQTYNLIDAAIVGRMLGTKSLAAVGASSSVQFMVLGFCIGICCGFGIPVAQRFGAGDHKGMREYVYHSMILTLATAVVLTGITAVFCSQILHLLSTPEDIFADAYRYLFIIFLGIPCSLLYNLLSAILRAVGDSRTPFLFLSVSTILNIVLDIVFIAVFHMGCGGAAFATITAQGLSGVLCLIFILRKLPILHIKKAERRYEFRYIKNLIIMGVPMGLQYSITAIGSMVMQSANNGLGSIYVSGFTAGMRIKQFAMCPFDAVATAVSTFAGQNLGAGKIDRVKKGILQGVAVGVTYGFLSGLALIFFGRTLSMMFVSSEAVAVLDAAGKYLRCLGYFYWALGILNICRMACQGIGYSGRAVYSGVTEMIARIIVSLIFVPMFGYTAICFADQTAWISAICYIVPTLIWCVRKVTPKSE